MLRVYSEYSVMLVTEHHARRDLYKPLCPSARPPVITDTAR